MPDTPVLQDQFGQPGGQKKGCGFPVAHWLAMMHAGTGMLTKMLTAPLRAHDLSGVTELHPELRAGDVLVGDRAFCSFVHLALLFQRGVQALMRIHQRQIVDFTPHRKHAVPGKGKTAYQKGLPRSRWLKQLGPTDQIVQWHKPTTCPTWFDPIQFAALPDTLVLRELRFHVTEKGFRTKHITLVTTLLDAEVYSFEAVAELYGQRWRIETNFAHIKITMEMDVLKCKTVEGVLKELTVFALIYNLVRQVMLEAARRQHVDVERISFIDALRWLTLAQPGDKLSKLVVNPHRPFRIEPRVRKRRPKQYPLMTQPRKILRKKLLS
jgi:Transposase DDE domain